MARHRIHGNVLARLLGEAAVPIYVVDDELTIVFLNQLCRDLIGELADQLIGRRCAYHSRPQSDEASAAAAGLCPPPEVLQGRTLSATVGLLRGGGRVRYRHARFVPLGGPPGELVAVVAMLGGEDLAGPITPPRVTTAEEDESLRLHAMVQQYRREAAAAYGVDQLLGASSAIRTARRQVELAATSRCSVVVAGPEGSGRRHVGSAIHYAGNRAQRGALVPVDCATLGPDLLHATLTTLATGEPLGPSTAESSLLLCDVDQLPPEAQADLAAILGGKPYPLRLLATAACPLKQRVAEAAFREDLAGLLSTLTIELPPLAARRQDIAPLAQMFLEEANSEGRRQIGGFAPEALDKLVAYGWPGNVDELGQVVAAAHKAAAGPHVLPADLPEKIHLAGRAAAHPRRRETKIVLDEFLGRVERELVQRALGQSKGNKAKAARLLGITRPKLYRRMVQLGLEEP